MLPKAIYLMHLYLELFLIGLLGSMHCVGMCGGFVAMYSLRGENRGPRFLLHILYNLGRMTTYTLLGGLLGYLGSLSAYLSSYKAIPVSVLLFAGAVMALMGLNMLGLLGRRGLFETDTVTGMPFFRRALHAALDMGPGRGTYLFGVLLGFLPCGLLYPIFMNAAISGGIVKGMLSLAIFGAGTVPALMGFGLIVSRIKPHLRLGLYRAAGVLIILLGTQTILRGMAFQGWIPPGRFW